MMWLRPTSWFEDDHLLALSSHDENREQLFSISSYKGINLIHRLYPYDLIISQRSHLLILSHQKLGIQHRRGAHSFPSKLGIILDTCPLSKIQSPPKKLSSLSISLEWTLLPQGKWLFSVTGKLIEWYPPNCPLSTITLFYTLQRLLTFLSVNQIMSPVALSHLCHFSFLKDRIYLGSLWSELWSIGLVLTLSHSSFLLCYLFFHFWQHFNNHPTSGLSYML